MKLTRQKIRELVSEQVRLRTEADTQSMSPVELSKTMELSPVEFAQELKRQQDLENYSEADMLNMWRQWSAAKRKKGEEEIPELPSSASGPLRASGSGRHQRAVSTSGPLLVIAIVSSK